MASHLEFNDAWFQIIILNYLINSPVNINLLLGELSYPNFCSRVAIYSVATVTSVSYITTQFFS